MMSEIEQDHSPPAKRWTIRTTIALIFIIGQLGLVFYSLFLPTQHFSWAPHNAMIAYEMDVRVDGQPLTIEEIQSRYGIQYGARDEGSWESHSIDNLFELIEIAETQYYEDHPAEVVITYRLAGEEEKTWHYPN